MASPRLRLSYWLLLLAAALAAIIACNMTSFAQATRDNGAIMSTIDQAIRTGEFGRAATVLRTIAEAGNAEAQYRLGSLYRVGRGVPHDDPLAFKWMKAAAEHNHARAQFNLGMMYLAGHGTALDVSAAKVWLQRAASRGYDDAAKLLLDISQRRTAEPRANATPAPVHATPRSPEKIATSLMLDAAWRGQTDAIKRLISSGADISARDDDGNTALLRAASAGKTQSVNTLLSAGAPVNEENHMGEQPLMLAAAGGYVDIVGSLLRRGADLAARTRRGETALTLAIRRCHQQVAKLLIDHRADVRAVLDHSMTLLMVAAAACPSDLVELLIAKG